MTRHNLICWLAPTLLLVPTTHCLAGDDVGPLVRSLWLVQRYGTAESVQPQNDQKLKGKLSKALGKEGILTAAGVQGLMDPSTFAKLAGGRCDSSIPPRSRRSWTPTCPSHASGSTPRSSPTPTC